MDREITYSKKTGTYIIKCFLSNETKEVYSLILALKYLTDPPIRNYKQREETPT